jgi:hypothetical protein
MAYISASQSEVVEHVVAEQFKVLLPLRLL